jgi:4-diphosphocytidyl-2-C-methyl-D-erythritol kinase
MPTLLAPAKINVTLEILGRRDDGYHTLRSVMLPIGLYDRIELQPSEAMRLSVDDPALGTNNLVLRALESAGVRPPQSVVLHKEIPVGGGLGGGSSDAAAVLRAAMDGRLEAPNGADWLGIARTLGSDVAFFLAGTGALVEGTGDRVTAIGALPAWWTVVVRPRVSVGTADAYRQLDARRASDGGWPSRPRSTSASLAAVDALQRADFEALRTALVNDFHDVVLEAYPAVARAHAALGAAGAPGALLSGSGSCLFALFEDEAAARGCAARIDATTLEAVFTVPLHHDTAWR